MNNIIHFWVCSFIYLPQSSQVKIWIYFSMWDPKCRFFLLHDLNPSTLQKNTYDLTSLFSLGGLTLTLPFASILWNYDAFIFMNELYSQTDDAKSVNCYSVIWRLRCDWAPCDLLSICQRRMQGVRWHNKYNRCSVLLAAHHGGTALLFSSPFFKTMMLRTKNGT